MASIDPRAEHDPDIQRHVAINNALGIWRAICFVVIAGITLWVYLSDPGENIWALIFGCIFGFVVTMIFNYTRAANAARMAALAKQRGYIREF